LNSKKTEDVRKRRAKPDTSSNNVYQKMILVAGVLTLFLAIGLSPMMAPILAAGIVGGTLLLFFLVRRIRPKGKESKGIEPVEPLRPVEEISPEHRDIPLTEEEKGSLDSPEIPPEEKEPAELQAISLEEREEGTPKEAVKDQEIVPGEKAPRKDRQEFPAEGTLAELQQRLALLEEKTNTLEDLLQHLEGKVADIQETQIKSEPKIDLQTILSNLDVKHGKIVP
jgi:hypothetical protein